MDNNAVSLDELIDEAILDSKQATFSPGEPIQGWEELHTPTLRKNIKYFYEAQMHRAVEQGRIEGGLRELEELEKKYNSKPKNEWFRDPLPRAIQRLRDIYTGDGGKHESTREN